MARHVWVLGVYHDRHATLSIVDSPIVTQCGTAVLAFEGDWRLSGQCDH